VVERDIFLKDHHYVLDGAMGCGIRRFRVDRQIAGVATTRQDQQKEATEKRNADSSSVDHGIHQSRGEKANLQGARRNSRHEQFA
jgi:hypothetical protein